MNAQELKEKYTMLYDYMAASKKPSYMMAFGNVMTEMIDWMIANKADVAQDMIEKLECIKWNNYLTPKEAEKIVSEMQPKAPWSREVWKNAMTQNNLPMQEEPYYNSCALWTTMNMIMSDSSETLKKYVGEQNLLKAVYELAIDKLKDSDSVFSIRHYFHL